jgi:hypothetical protein
MPYVSAAPTRSAVVTAASAPTRSRAMRKPGSRKIRKSRRRVCWRDGILVTDGSSREDAWERRSRGEPGQPEPVQATFQRRHRRSRCARPLRIEEVSAGMPRKTLGLRPVWMRRAARIRRTFRKPLPRPPASAHWDSLPLTIWRSAPCDPQRPSPAACLECGRSGVRAQRTPQGERRPNREPAPDRERPAGR